MPSGTLYPPLFPQMENDGVINLLELTTSGIVIIIEQYSNAQPGDFIELWFESYAIDSIGLADTPVSEYFPWVCNITPELASRLSDGIYKVQYNVVDAAQNSAWSSIGKAIIDRSSSGTLPPPLFPEAGLDNTLSYDDAMSGGGTPITIPAYPEITVGDHLTLYWVGLANGQVVQESITNVSHIVQSDELNGFDILIATAFIIPEDVNSARAWYIVQKSDTRNERSENGTVNIDATAGNTLPAPEFVEGNNEWIDANEATSDGGTPVKIPAYPGISVDDIVTTHWQGFNQAGESIPESSYQHITRVAQEDLMTGFIVNIPTDKLLPVEIGSGISYYNVQFKNGEQGSSLAAEIDVDIIHTIELPAPELPEALDNGIIDNNDALSNGGTPVDISYQPMSEGDNVTVFWSCYKEEVITPVPGTVYSTTRSVSASEAAQQSITITIPSKYITPTGEGYAVVNYSVNFQSGGIGYSDDAVVDIDTVGHAISGSSYFGGSTGYAPWNNTVIQGCYVKYRAMYNGLPLYNVDVTLTLYGDNYFTNNELESITLKTDLQGFVETNISGSDTKINTITAEVVGSNIPASILGLETERTNEISVPYITSEPYIPGSGNRQFTLSVSQDMGVFTLSTNNNADIYIDGVNKGGVVNNLSVYSSDPIKFSISTNNLNNTVLLASRSDSVAGDYCSYYF